MRWAVAMNNIEIGKWQLITPDMTVDGDDPMFADEVHIVPVVEDPKDSTYLSFGVHDFVPNCACHPKVEPQCGSRTIITHTAVAN